ncbi:unnamed protein product [Chilo suppressalis]|uniref:Glucosylceramidase n=1 Tax=Chilo suppressalis TaxID=168631 RepID=A0ABN8B3T2_CHISP|nr:unnamed protein product [Chilo suppressalis]
MLFCKTNLFFASFAGFIGSVWLNDDVGAGRPCLQRQIPDQSVVCVCSPAYCDDLVRDTPTPDKYVMYTSSEAGMRFVKTTHAFKTNENDSKRDQDNIVLTLDPSIKYQTVLGFGGAVTDAASINWKNLTDPGLMQKLIDSYFSKSGLQYNMLRVPIGGCDFSTHPYAYNEIPENDPALSNYSLAYEDHHFKIPMIKEIMKVASDPVYIVASTWSPPPWMKTNRVYANVSQLKPEYYQTYAEYFLKFVEQYANEGIKIWGITTTNEPLNGMFGIANFNSLGWAPLNLGRWIANHLGPTIRNSAFRDLKIISHDDQRATVPFYINMMLRAISEASQYIDGFGVHYYTDLFVSAEVFSLVTENYPDKFILATESCEGSFPWQKEKVVLGSWDRAKAYAVDIIDDLNQNVVGWIDWNLCLNAQGGPNWARNFVDSAIIVFPESKEFVKQPMYYALSHFSKFLPRGSRRIKVTERKPLWSSRVTNVAFQTPKNTVVVILHNEDLATNVSIEIGQKKITVPVPNRSIVTIEMLNVG